ncbi:MAG: Gfo/Idh/MocA family oxidoreductase [Pirellulales bacterium]
MKTAVVGMGRMGRRHVEVVLGKQLPLVAICDRFPEAVESAGNEFAVPTERRFTDFEKMLVAQKPECVVVATHAPSHCEFVCTAARHGARYILCEKPMAVSIAECDEMLVACSKAGAKLAINHQMRFMEQYTAPKALITDAAFGGLSSVTAVTGNFGMAMNGTHYFEMFRFMADEPPETVQAWFSDRYVPNPRGPEFQDRAGEIRVTTAAGKRFYLESGDDQGHGLHVTYAGPRGLITVNELLGAMHVSIRKAEYRELPTTRYGMPCDESDVTIKPADSTSPTRTVLDALLAEQNYPTGQDGRLAVLTLVAAYVSHERGGLPVKLDDPQLPVDRRFPWA